jgi:hypothetical protein
MMTSFGFNISASDYAPVSTTQDQWPHKKIMTRKYRSSRGFPMGTGSRPFSNKTIPQIEKAIRLARFPAESPGRARITYKTYLLCGFPGICWRYGYPSNTERGKSMKFISRLMAAKLWIIFSLLLGCQTITELTRIESDKDAAISKAVKANFLKDKVVDLTDVSVKTTNGSVDLRGTVTSLEARERAVKLAWQAAGVQSVVNHLEVKK